MMSTFSGIELAKSSLQAQQLSLSVAGHNIANMNNPGYTKESVHVANMPPLYETDDTRVQQAGQVGQGVRVASISADRDAFLDQAISGQNHHLGYWSDQAQSLKEIQSISQKGNDQLRQLMNQFWSSWQNLSLHPDSLGARSIVLQSAQALTSAFHNQAGQLVAIQKQADQNVGILVHKINQYTQQITKLNIKIHKATAIGDHPNDLIDSRQVLVDKLSKLIPIHVEQKSPTDQFNIFVRGQNIVQGSIHHDLHLSSDPQNGGLNKISWHNPEQAFHPGGGQLQSALNTRDKIVPNQLSQLDTLAVYVADKVNAIHTHSYSLSGKTGIQFFHWASASQSSNGSIPATISGRAKNLTTLFRISGSKVLHSHDILGISGKLSFSKNNQPVTIDYSAKDTVGDLLSKINKADLGISAQLDTQGHLTFRPVNTKESNEVSGSTKAVPSTSFYIPHLQDSGYFLTSYSGILKNSGPGGSFDWQNTQAIDQLQAQSQYSSAPLTHASEWINVNPNIVTDPSLIAASNNANPEAMGDNKAALAIAQLQVSPNFLGQGVSLDTFFNKTESHLGVITNEAIHFQSSYKNIMGQLTQSRQSETGVNMNDEVMDMMKFEQAYSATARFLSQYEGMLDTLINKILL